MAISKLSTKEKYDRASWRYDLMDFFTESLFFGQVSKITLFDDQGRQNLEVGVGTGKNIQYYPGDARVTAIDFSEEMMK